MELRSNSHYGIHCAGILGIANISYSFTNLATLML